MQKKLKDVMPSTDVLLNLEPEELAGFLLQYFQLQGDVNNFKEHPHNFPDSNILEGYPQEKHYEITIAMMEAWNVLEREGLLVRRPGPDGWYIFSRRAKRIKTKQDYEAFQHANLFPKDTIHPEFLKEVYPLFLRCDYETATFKAFKLVEIAVRDAMGTEFEEMFGRDLMIKAFHSENGLLTDPDEQKAEREALQFLFVGAIGRFKNPSSHRRVAINDPKQTIEMLQFASHLLRIVRDREKLKNLRDTLERVQKKHKNRTSPETREKEKSS